MSAYVDNYGRVFQIRLSMKWGHQQDSSWQICTSKQHMNSLQLHIYGQTSPHKPKKYEGVFFFFIFNPMRWCHDHMLKQPFNKFSHCKQILKKIFSHKHNHHVIHNRTGQVFGTPKFCKDRGRHTSKTSVFSIPFKPHFPPLPPPPLYW